MRVKISLTRGTCQERGTVIWVNIGDIRAHNYISVSGTSEPTPLSWSICYIHISRSSLLRHMCTTLNPVIINVHIHLNQRGAKFMMSEENAKVGELTLCVMYAAS